MNCYKCGQKLAVSPHRFGRLLMCKNPACEAYEQVQGYRHGDVFRSLGVSCVELEQTPGRKHFHDRVYPVTIKRRNGVLQG